VTEIVVIDHMKNLRYVNNTSKTTVYLIPYINTVTITDMRFKVPYCNLNYSTETLFIYSKLCT